MYKAKLHDGEVELMILAQERKADFFMLAMQLNRWF
ncbi:hypothetical protein C817_02459 [Dorea sp. 5-2]|nr:hypothetical protein C817_02459 [Dorea sp. 5-2]